MPQVEDFGAELICSAHGLLKPGGVYVIISFRQRALLEPLLDSIVDVIPWTTIEFHCIRQRVGADATLCLLRKAATGPQLPFPASLATSKHESDRTAESVAHRIDHVMDWWYTEMAPLLTPAREREIRSRWFAAAAAATAAAAAAATEMSPSHPAGHPASSSPSGPGCGSSQPYAADWHHLSLSDAFSILLTSEEQDELGLEAFCDYVVAFLQDRNEATTASTDGDTADTVDEHQIDNVTTISLAEGLAYLLDAQ